jgi:Family of unknown function (DUF6335)
MKRARTTGKPRARSIDANQVVSPNEPIDSEVQLQFDAASRVPEGARQLRRKLASGPGPNLSGGDIDAAWDRSDAGEETVGGSVSTPDQDTVEDLGKVAGLVYEDNEALHTATKLQGRDRNRWELNPASSEDFQTRRLSERQPEDRKAPLRSRTPRRGPSNKRKRASNDQRRGK